MNKKRVALFGAAPDTPNMGVSALFMSTITGLSQHFDALEFVVFDNGLGLREETLIINDNKSVKLIRFGARGGRRYYRAENIFTMLMLSKLGRLGSLFNKGLDLIDTCDAVLDVSGGDSFSDIYGLDRFNNVNRPKQIALNRNKNLILLPQTYGPYKASDVKLKATTSIRNATIAWARDEDSYKILTDLLGAHFSKSKHHCGVDMAFGLQPSNASNLITPIIAEWFNNKNANEPLVGINVSGLIYNDSVGAKENYGFKADYENVINEFIRWLLDKTQSKVLLVSHVMDMPGHFESDFEACEKVAMSFKNNYPNRIEVAPAVFNESQVKWLISKMDWFCGTRMHSTIAGLSSLVPTAAVSYSDKTKGVFDTCEQGEHVIDPRVVNTEEAIQLLIKSFNAHKHTLETLPQHLNKVTERLERQMQTIAENI